MFKNGVVLYCVDPRDTALNDDCNAIYYLDINYVFCLHYKTPF